MKTFKKYRACVYVRLSKEDGDLDGSKAESNSISNQKSLIMNFLKDKEDIEVVSVREDDGYTGTNFDRPAFQKMMEDVRDGKINCIAVKDFSRFGREYIDSGRYLQRLFPAMGVRFIAINDGYDSASGNTQANEIIVPFINLMNDSYCRDISIKIRSHLEVKRQNGEFVANYCPYGYKKDEQNHNRIVPDEYTGKVVQDIFAWIIGGMSIDAVGKKLNSLGILSPLEQRLLNGERMQQVFKKKDTAEWSATTVRRIATNPIYTGTLVQGRTTTPNHKVKVRVEKPKDQWAVVEENHEALVSAYDFAVVQHLLSLDMRKAPERNTVYLLSGIAVCADCGALMTRKTSTVKGKKYAYYMCSNFKNNKECSSHRIREDVLEGTVTETLRDMIADLIDAEDVIARAGENKNRRIDIRKMEERIEANEAVIKRYNQMLVKLYEDYTEGVVKREDFRIIKESFEKKKTDAERANDRIRMDAEEQEKSGELRGEWMKEFKKYRNLTSLTRKAVVELLREIRVHEDRSIELVLNCNDEYCRRMERARTLAEGNIQQEPDNNMGISYDEVGQEQTQTEDNIFDMNDYRMERGGVRYGA